MPRVHYRPAPCIGTARRPWLHRRLRHGQQCVRPLGAEAAVAPLTQLRFEIEPREKVQVDWRQVRVRFACGPATIHVLVMTLDYSRRACLAGYEHERTEIAAPDARARRWHQLWPVLQELQKRQDHVVRGESILVECNLFEHSWHRAGFR